MHNSNSDGFLSFGMRLTLMAVVALVGVITIGYVMCFGAIRSNIMWTIIMVCVIVLAYAIFGDRKHQRPVVTETREFVVEVEAPTDGEPLQAYPSGTVATGDYVLMNSLRGPFNFTQYDPTSDI